ncbi:adenylate cyclase associated N terminal-domain-containing protein [Scleroderma yunnanense]
MSTPQQGMYTLATLIKRLEAVASRFEDFEESTRQSFGQQNTIAKPDVPGPHTAHSSRQGLPPPPAIIVQPMAPRSVIEFDTIVMDGSLNPFLELTKAFAPQSLIVQVTLFADQLHQLREILLIAAACKKPDTTKFAELLGPLQVLIQKVSSARDSARKEREWFNHFSVLAEGSACVGWITIEPKPAAYLNEIKESAKFYSDRVLKEFKGKDARHAEWVRAFIGIIDEMKRYVLENHPTGLVWNTSGVQISEYKAPSSTPASSEIAAPPSPPPPPPPPPAQVAPAAPVAGGVAAVFADLNRGDEVTKGLRKVDKSEMTHKNPALRAGSVVPASSGATAGKKPVKPTKPQALMGKKPAKFALEGNKWIIEYQENESCLEVSDVEINQLVNIFGCKNTTVIVKGKVNAVTMLNCTKTSVLVDSVISSIEITKSASFALQITGAAPTIQVDSTDSGQIYLSKACLGVEITTAKCSAINVSLPVVSEEDGIFEEQAVPEMLKTVVKDGRLVTSVVEHVG